MFAITPYHLEARLRTMASAAEESAASRGPVRRFFAGCFMENDRMKRNFLIAALGLVALALTGCSYEGSAITAEVPGGYHGQSGTAPSNGVYTLFHVTEFDVWGAPSKTEKVTTIQLKASEHLGFEYYMPADKAYQADAHSDVIAYAGSKFRKNLGSIQTMDDHYYWANADDWDGYWSSRPMRVLGKRATLY